MPANAQTFPPLVYLALIALALVCAAIFTYCTTRHGAMTAHAIESTTNDWFTRLCRWIVGMRR